MIPRGSLRGAKRRCLGGGRCGGLSPFPSSLLQFTTVAFFLKCECIASMKASLHFEDKTMPPCVMNNGGCVRGDRPIPAPLQATPT